MPPGGTAGPFSIILQQLFSSSSDVTFDAASLSAVVNSLQSLAKLNLAEDAIEADFAEAPSPPPAPPSPPPPPSAPPTMPSPPYYPGFNGTTVTTVTTSTTTSGGRRRLGAASTGSSSCLAALSKHFTLVTTKVTTSSKAKASALASSQLALALETIQVVNYHNQTIQPCALSVVGLQQAVIAAPSPPPPSPPAPPAPPPAPPARPPAEPSSRPCGAPCFTATKQALSADIVASLGQVQTAVLVNVVVAALASIMGSVGSTAAGATGGAGGGSGGAALQGLLVAQRFTLTSRLAGSGLASGGGASSFPAVSGAARRDQPNAGRRLEDDDDGSINTRDLLIGRLGLFNRPPTPTTSPSPPPRPPAFPPAIPSDEPQAPPPPPQTPSPSPPPPAAPPQSPPPSKPRPLPPSPSPPPWPPGSTPLPPPSPPPPSCPPHGPPPWLPGLAPVQPPPEEPGSGGGGAGEGGEFDLADAIDSMQDEDAYAVDEANSVLKWTLADAACSMALILSAMLLFHVLALVIWARFVNRSYYRQVQAMARNIEHVLSPRRGGDGSDALKKKKRATRGVSRVVRLSLRTSLRTAQSQAQATTRALMGSRLRTGLGALGAVRVGGVGGVGGVGRRAPRCGSSQARAPPGSAAEEATAAAKTMQAHFRRRHVQALAKAKQANLVETSAATQLQAAVRRRRAQAKLFEYQSATRLQARWRSKMAAQLVRTQYKNNKSEGNAGALGASSAPPPPVKAQKAMPPPKTAGQNAAAARIREYKEKERARYVPPPRDPILSSPRRASKSGAHPCPPPATFS